MFIIPASSFLDSAFDLTTIACISAIIILSILSSCFIFHLRFKSKSLIHLQDFNSLWTVRFLLVLFIFFWAITELFRVPLFRRKYLYPFLPTLGVAQEAYFCKLHIVFSLGFFEPAFLVTLLFLLNASIRKKIPDDIWAITFVTVSCLPIAILQAFLIFLKPLQQRLPVFFRQTAIVMSNDSGDETVLCAYPLLNTFVFGAFGVAYAIWFLFSCWRVLALVINKNLRIRIYGLASAILVSLPLQILSLVLTVLWKPDEQAYGVVALVVFLGACCCATAGEGILVIKPISDALDAGESWYQSRPSGGASMRPETLRAEAAAAGEWTA